MSLDPQDFSLDLVKSVTPPGHLWVGSGRTTVEPVDRTACGVGAFFSPPVAAHSAQLALSFLVDGTHTVVDTGNWGKGDVGLLYQGGTWHPGRLERRGTWHHYQDGALRSLAVVSSLVPLFTAAGYVLTLAVTNRSDRAATVGVHPRLEPGKVENRKFSDWVFGLFKNGQPSVEVAPGVFRGHGLELKVTQTATTLTLAPGATGTVHVVVTAGPGRAPDVADAGRAVAETRKAWERRIAAYTERFPQVSGTVPGLADYYHRSVASGLVCVWEDPAYVVRPFLATSGVDGGALNTYLWDLGGYVPMAATLLLGADIVPIARALARVPLETNFAIALDGSPSGTPYSYSVFSFLSLVWAISTLQGPDEALYREALRLFEDAEKRFPSDGVLLDYGEQRNMLEMRGSGWEHFIASPNAERAWCLERLADLGLWFGGSAEAAAAQRAHAQTIRRAICERLWDPEKRWFKSVFPDGHVEYSWSVQAFDALRFGACDPAMEAALLDEVADGKFLGTYGVSSVSRTDTVHYEVNDPDWSGSGSYAGDGPNLAATLFERGRPERAWDVLARHVWMGRHLPYFPQEHRCEVPQTVAHKRANVVSGLAGAEALVFGALGLTVDLDGTIRARPAPAPGTVTFQGLKIRGAVIDAELSPDRARIVCDGRTVHDGPPAPILVRPAQETRHA